LREQLEARERQRARAKKARRPKATYDLPAAMIQAVQDEDGHGDQNADTDSHRNPDRDGNPHARANGDSQYML